MADKITVLTDAEEEMLNQIDPRAFTVKLGSKIKRSRNNKRITRERIKGVI